MDLFKNKKNIILLLIVLASVLLLFILEKGQIINLYSSPSPNADEAQTTSNEKSAQADFSDGDENKDPGNTIRENQGTANVSDSGGTPSTDTSKPTESKTGEIKLFLPHANSVISSGQEISGTSSLAIVSYRIIDNVSGVIASGELRVVNGNFSGNIGFNTSANEGRIDVFGVKEDGTEFSNIEVPVRFKR